MVVPVETHHLRKEAFSNERIGLAIPYGCAIQDVRDIVARMLKDKNTAAFRSKDQP